MMWSQVLLSKTSVSVKQPLRADCFLGVSFLSCTETSTHYLYQLHIRLK